jgi:hypothetical protein
MATTGTWSILAQVDGPRAGRRQADPDLARHLGEAARHEGGHLLVADLDEAAAVIVAVEGAHDPVAAVPRVPEHVGHAPVGEALQDLVGDRLAHHSLLGFA